MIVKVIIYGVLELGKETRIFDLSPGSTVSLITRQIGLSENLLFVLNGSVVNQDTELNDKDLLEIFSPLSGG